MNSLSPQNILKNIKAFAENLEIDDLDAVAPIINERDKNYFKNFISKGYQLEMNWLAKNIEKRLDPKNLMPNVKSVLVCAMNYAPNSSPLKDLKKREKANISVYARSRDYHLVFKSKLRKLANFISDNYKSDVKIFVDTAPILERSLISQSNIGWQGKHTNIISKKYGNWIFLGSIFTDLTLPLTNEIKDHCGSCQKCIKICPTNALKEPYKLNVKLCLAYWSNEHKGIIPDYIKSKMGNRVFGCDDCLAICPWNKFAKHSIFTSTYFNEKLSNITISEMLEIDKSQFNIIFSKTPVKRLGYEMFLRNTIIIAGNSSNKNHQEMIKIKLAKFSDNIAISDAANWALGQLNY